MEINIEKKHQDYAKVYTILLCLGDEMKKLSLTVLTLLTCGSAYALPVGNPSEASLYVNGIWCETSCCDPCDPCFNWLDSWSFRLGFAGEYVFNRHMEVDHHSGGVIDTTTLYSNAGYLALNFCDRFDIFSRLGVSKLHIRTDARSWGSTISQESELGFETQFSWSIGARATLWECGCFAVGLEGEYFQTKPDVDYFLSYNSGALTYFDDVDAKYREWQVGLGASYRFATSCPTFAFVPYVAVVWAGSKLDLDDYQFNHRIFFDNGTTLAPQTESLVLRDLESNKMWGYAIGVSFTMSDMIGVTVEGRFADEKALYVNGQVRF